MSARDKLYKQLSREKDSVLRAEISKLCKRYRNLIVTVLKKGKQNYSALYFMEHQNNAKKTWDGIRNLINVSKKKTLPATKLVHNKQLKTSNSNIAQTLNEFFVHIGESVEAKNTSN